MGSVEDVFLASRNPFFRGFRLSKNSERMCRRQMLPEVNVCFTELLSRLANRTAYVDAGNIEYARNTHMFFGQVCPSTREKTAKFLLQQP